MKLSVRVWVFLAVVFGVVEEGVVVGVGGVGVGVEVVGRGGVLVELVGVGGERRERSIIEVVLLGRIRKV